MKIIDSIKSASEKLAMPENYFHGLCLPEGFALPDNILMFYSRWGVSAEQAHGRYQLVIPFSPVIYCVEQSRYELDAGMALFLSPWQKHNHLPGSEKVLCERLIITFALPSPQRYLPGYQLLEFSEAARRHTAEMLQCYAQRNLPALAWNLMRLLQELTGNATAPQEKKLSELTVNCLALITRNLRNAPDIQFLADKLKISASHLRMTFRRDMGIGIGKFIADQRLLAACVQLQNHELSIQQIADNCGFASISAFCHFFKNKTGLSPRHFRASTGDAPM